VVPDSVRKPLGGRMDHQLAFAALHERGQVLPGFIPPLGECRLKLGKLA
jgi:hypothetical protein